jgi:hypothetical protein
MWQSKNFSKGTLLVSQLATRSGSTGGGLRPTKAEPRDGGRMLALFRLVSGPHLVKTEC